MSSKEQKKYKYKDRDDDNINSLTPDDILRAMGRNYNVATKNCQQAVDKVWRLWTRPRFGRAIITNDDEECPDWQDGNSTTPTSASAPSFIIITHLAGVTLLAFLPSIF